MLHELLLSLSGVPGDIFVFKQTSRLPKTVLSLEYTFLLHPSETVALERLARLGALVDYIQKQTLKFPNGIYYQSLDFEIQNILKEYQNVVVECEGQLLSTKRSMSLTFLESVFAPYHTSLFAIAECLMHLDQKSDTTRGCQLLSMVQDRMLSGDPIVKEAFTSTLYKQIRCWLMYGKLVDPYREFFIQLDNQDKQSDFTIDFTMLSDVYSTKMAQELLFIGKVVCFLSQFQESEGIHLPQELIRIALFGWEEQVEKVLDQCPSLPKGHTTSQLVRTLKDNVSIRLKKILFNQGRLLKFLNAFRDVFLLGKGDLTLLFQDAFLNLECDATQYRHLTYSEANDILHEWGAPKELAFVQPSGEESTPPNWLLGTPLTLKFNIPRELSIFLNQADMVRYYDIYTFLGEIKAVHAQLDCALIGKSTVLKSRSNACLKRKMDCFFGSLWAYLQMDVMDPQFARLYQIIEDSNDFSVMHEAHSTFLDAIEKHCWLRIPAIMERLKNVIQTCYQICKTFKIVDKNQIQTLDILAKEFDRDTHFLVQVWTALPDGVAMIPLLSRLDFNHWYTFS